MKKLPLFIILAGLVVIGIGVWQIVETKFQTDSSLKEAKEIVAKAESRAKLILMRKHLRELKKLNLPILVTQ